MAVPQNAGDNVMRSDMVCLELIGDEEVAGIVGPGPLLELVHRSDQLRVGDVGGVSLVFALVYRSYCERKNVVGLMDLQGSVYIMVEIEAEHIRLSVVLVVEADHVSSA
jgi:hypothetical protein